MSVVIGAAALGRVEISCSFISPKRTEAGLASIKDIFARNSVTTAYVEMIRRAHELQTRIIFDKAAIAEFDDDAMPNWDFLRQSGHSWDVRSRWIEERMKKSVDYAARHAELMAQIEWLETMFAENKKRDNEAWAEAMADFLRTRR